ncbi:MAG: AbrB/MazE/SpoVT family DNA-binding domain-containing protein [Ruminococcaceae bacterium]|nr:AbrB/MazE/SpoVT family DNA-binding domain-containing protein [Oscillospiraceae bacterium]
MKAAGYLVRVDELGRIVIPVKIRRMLDFDKGSCLEVFTEEQNLVIRKYASSCAFCQSEDNLFELKGKFICKSCLEEISGK